MSEHARADTVVSAEAEQPAPAGWSARWRRFYSSLPASIQLIGLQLWLPVLFIIMFCFCYIAAFHAPHVHDAPVGVVGPQSSQVVAQLQSVTGASIAYATFDTEEAGLDAVREGEVIGTLVFSDDPAAAPTLVTAGAHQFQAQQIVTSTFLPLFAAQGAPLETIDLAPLPAHDSMGMTPMYLMLAWCIGGYMVAMFIGMMGAPLLHRTRVAIILGGAVVLSLLANVLAGPVIGAVDGHLWQLTLIGIGWMVAIGLAVNGLSYFFGRFITLPAILIFVFLSIPASGAAYPTWMLPSVFTHLQPFVVGRGMTEMIKRTLYGVGEPYSAALVQMLGYAVVGLVLMAIGKPWRQRREATRILAGKTTMMADAQNAARDHGIEARAAVLAKYTAGTDAAPDQRDARIMEDEDEQAGDAFLNYGHALTGLGQDQSPPSGSGGRPT